MQQLHKFEFNFCDKWRIFTEFVNSFFIINEASYIFYIFVLAATKVNVPIFIFVLSVNSPHHWGNLKDFVKKHWDEDKVFSHWGEKNKIVGSFKNTLY